MSMTSMWKKEKTTMISFWHRLLNLISPDACVVCGCRLGVEEEVMCTSCNLHLPRTFFAAQGLDNPMARRFWGRIPIERAAALFYYEAGSEVSSIIYQLKYNGRPDIGEVMGRMTAEEFAASGFFEGIDLIIPVPLAKKRERQRGYNQSECVARGVAAATGLPVVSNAVKRISFTESQTHKSLRERMENVEDAFRLTGKVNLQNRHVLMVDDIVTSGATICSCVKSMVAESDLRVSVLSLGVVK